MKNIALTLAMLLVLAACSSGSSEAPQPVNTTSNYTGTYQSNNGSDSGSVTLDIFESTTDQTISGNLFFTPNNAANSCLLNTTVTGNTDGFNMTLVTAQFSETVEIYTTVTEVTDGTGTVIRSTTSESRSGTVGTVVTTSGSQTTTRVTTVAEETVSGVMNIQLSINNDGANLSGTYIVDGDICSNQTGSGSMNLNRS